MASRMRQAVLALPLLAALTPTVANAAALVVPRPAVLPLVSKSFDSGVGPVVQHFVVPAEVTSLSFDVIGADSSGAGGYSAELTGSLAVVPGQVLDIWVGMLGGVGETVSPFSGGVGGWGGRDGTRHGGNGGTGSDTIAGLGGGAAGGGATEIDIENDTPSSIVAIVAGGGGGSAAGAASGCTGSGAGGCAQSGSGIGGDGQVGDPKVFAPIAPGRGGGPSGGGAAGSPSGGGAVSATAGGGTATGEGGLGGSQFAPYPGGGGGGGGGWGGGGGGGGASAGSGALPSGGGAGGSMGPAGTTFARNPSFIGGLVTLSYKQPADWSKFVPMAPTRLLDTRLAADITGGLPIAPDHSIDLQIAGNHGIPASGVVAVALNITAAMAAAPGFVTAWPTGQDRPEVSNLNVTAAGQNIANAAIIRVGSGGLVSFYSQSGTDLVVDVQGYFLASGATTGGRYTALAPTRVLDTRSANGVPGTGPVAPAGSISVIVAGRGDVPATGVSAVVLNVTAAQATGPGFVTVWPSGQPQPTASNLNVGFAGQNIANLVIVPLGIGGMVSLYTQAGTHLVADVAGWFGDTTQPASAAGLFEPLSPTRILDTRFALGVATTTPVPPDRSIDLTVTGHGGAGLAPSFSAVVVNVTAAQATGPGFVTVWPQGQAQPVVSNLNVTAIGQNIPNLVLVRTSTAGAVSIFTQGGGHLVADIAGTFITG